jgi:hypothetical protein
MSLQLCVSWHNTLEQAKGATCRPQLTPNPLAHSGLCVHVLQNLQNATNNDCLKQWQMNQDMFARLGITQAKGLAVRGVVTPAITGELGQGRPGLV